MDKQFVSPYPLHSHLYWMDYAHSLAQKGYWTCKPNPAVGCVMVRYGQVIAEGYHQFAGEAHAEINAIHQLQQRSDVPSMSNTVIYITLEPCSHYGKTPPCTDALLALNPSTVVVGVRDPNPKVAGSGIQKLRAQGVEVLLIEDASMYQKLIELNSGFMHRMQQGRPKLVLKIATSLDGRTTAADGESKWLTSPASREDVHLLRLSSDVLMTGINTVLRDDPSLNVRLPQQWFDEQKIARARVEQLSPILAILDSRLQISSSSMCLKTTANVIIFTTAATLGSHEKKVSELHAMSNRERQVVVKAVPTLQQGDVSVYTKLDLQAVLAYLAECYDLNQIMVEAGARLAGQLLQAAMVDELWLYQSPDLLGEGDAAARENKLSRNAQNILSRPMADLPLVKTMSDKIRMHLMDVQVIGHDVRLRYVPNLAG